MVGEIRFVFEGVEACVSAVVASRGRAERMIEEERFGGMEEGDSWGIVSVIAGSCPWGHSGRKCVVSILTGDRSTADRRSRV
jgi:hypothetical protein